MRKVIVFSRQLIDKQWQTVEVNRGIFHTFGVDYEEFESGAGNYSTAIVEFPDGSIGNIRVELIKFIQPIGDSN